MKIFSALKYALFLGGLSLPLATNAAAVTFDFTGVVTANNSLAGTPSIGSITAGGFTIDDSNTSGAGSNCVAIANCWSDSATAWNWDGPSIQLGGATTLPTVFRVYFSIVDSAAGSGLDELTITLKGDLFTVGELFFTDSTGSAFESSTSLMPAFASFDSATYNFQPSCVGGALACLYSARHSGDIASLTSPAVIPVPAAVYLFATALGSLLLGGHARHKKI